MKEQLSLPFLEEAKKPETKAISQAVPETEEMARARITLEYYKELVIHERSELNKLRLQLVTAARKGRGVFDYETYTTQYQTPIAHFLIRIDALLGQVAAGENVDDELQKMVEDFEEWKASAGSQLRT